MNTIDSIKLIVISTMTISYLDFLEIIGFTNLKLIIKVNLVLIAINFGGLVTNLIDRDYYLVMMNIMTLLLNISVIVSIKNSGGLYK